MRIEGISSRRLPDPAEGHIGNFNLYNDKELFEDADLDWYDYGFRSYDPQIGRFVQLDPLTDEYPFLTPYQYASCDPITNIDLDGLEGVGAIASGLGTTAGTAKVLDEVVVVGYKMAAKVTTSTLSLSGIALKIAVNGFRSLSKSGKNTLGTGGPLSNWWQDITNNYIDDNAKLSAIKNSLNEAWSMTGNKIRELKRWNAGDETYFRKSFGVDDDFSRDVILNRLRNVYSLLQKFMINNTYKSQFFETTQANEYAHVYSSDPDQEIFLGKPFWTALLTGTDSRSGTLLHEMSHFKGIGSTKDHAYGLANAKNLALRDPQKAIYNADSFEYYL